jgi:cell division septum initiation protein DivIVA
VTPMSDLDKLREELDDMRVRVAGLEFERDTSGRTSGRAIAAAQAADRQLAKSRSEWREVVKDLEAGMSQIISLLTSSAACLPARLPENTQSASDSPLT